MPLGYSESEIPNLLMSIVEEIPLLTLDKRLLKVVNFLNNQY